MNFHEIAVSNLVLIFRGLYLNYRLLVLNFLKPSNNDDL